MLIRILLTLLCTALFNNISYVDARSFENSYAVIIGLNQYSQLGLSNLKNAESDANAISTYFRAQGYKIYKLIGSIRAQKRILEKSIRKIAAVITEKDRFVFFFAGHGKSKKIEGLDSDIAYLVLNGGHDKNDPNSLISTGDIRKYSSLLSKAHHQLYIFDSCYAGIMGHFNLVRSDKPRYRYNSDEFLKKDLRSRKVCQYLSAGGPDQEVLDDGFAGLSWFTYFFLKGLEQGMVQNRPDGLITFRELSNFVQTRAANPRHTPSAGSFPGHKGGEYLFFSKLMGNPVIDDLPTINKNILKDLGFLTRATNYDLVYSNIDKMRKPIDLLFLAWEKKDFDLYMNQLHPEIIMTGRYKSGRTYRRNYKRIKKHRWNQFNNLLDRAEVLKYELMYQGSDGNDAVFGVRYSMDFFWKNNKISKEKNISECYKVTQSPYSNNQWVIIRNDDYQYKMCSY